MRTWHFATLAVLSGCLSDDSFTAMDGHYTDPSLRLHAAVHQRIETTGERTTKFEVWVARSTQWTGAPPQASTIIRDATVRVGGEADVDATLVESERGAHYVAELDHWITDVHVTAQVGAEEIAITGAEMISSPDEMNAQFPDVVIPGAASTLRWSSQGAPVTPWIMVATAEDPIRFTLITQPIKAETGRFELPVETFATPGYYALNLVRMVDYDLVPGDSYEDQHIGLTANSYFHKRVTAASAPVP